MNTIAKYVFAGIVILCAIAIVCYCFKGCGPKLPDHSQDQKTVDSLVQKAISDSIVTFKRIDSATRTIVILNKEKDSILKLLVGAKIFLTLKNEMISDMINNINASEKNLDTAKIIAGCDSLIALYPSTKALVSTYISQNDSLIKVNNSILSDKDTIIKRISDLYSMSNTSLFETSRLYGNLQTDYKKAVKSAGKRFGIGPEISVGLVGGRFAVVPGLGIHYSLLKF